MGADAAVSIGADVAIYALHADVIWVSAFYEVSQNGHGISTVVTVQPSPVLCARSIDVSKSQKHLFCFSATRAEMSVVVIHFLFLY
jgi:hypothetical protein